MSEFKNTAVLGAGVIGMSWAALFLASGRNVAVFDTVASAEKSTRDYVEMAWPALRDLGLIKDGAPGRLTFHKSAAEAVRVADFVQENVPERIEIKKALFAEIEPALKSDAIVASSASGLTLSEMQAGWREPSRFVLGHPFNPPHLIPLVEVLANELTEAGWSRRRSSSIRISARSPFEYDARCPVTSPTACRPPCGERRCTW